MAFDTLWMNEIGDYIALKNYVEISARNVDSILALKENTNTYFGYDNKNTPLAYQLIQKIKIEQKISTETQFDKDKEYYDSTAAYIEILILFMFCASVLYARKRLKQLKENPFGQDEKNWVEIGSGPILGTESEREIYAEQLERKKQTTRILVYNGRELKFTNEEIKAVLTKRFSFFDALGMEKKNIFINRLNKFMKQKYFKIHDKKGFKEMPIMLSATAIQLSFGLEDYLLPHYKEIHIFPQEFLGIQPSIRFLEGNVSGNCINISWKHYLEGYNKNDDGQNVGLHEMAHAYYCQFNFYNINKTIFTNDYNEFKKKAIIISLQEQNSSERIYTLNAFRNIDEFWAESVELFFEKPMVLKEKYPLLYEKVCVLLNQDLTIVK